jgi:hypothetical protein
MLSRSGAMGESGQQLPDWPITVRCKPSLPLPRLPHPSHDFGQLSSSRSAQDRRNNLRVLQSDVLLKPARVAELHGGWGREGLESPSCYFLYSEGGARISIMTGPGNSSPHP